MLLVLQSIRDTYNELVNFDDNTSKETFNYLVGKLSVTMDTVATRACIVNEIKKKINGETKDNGFPRGNTTHNDNVRVVEKSFIKGFGMMEEILNTMKARKMSKIRI